ncbi:MAG: hypothetical protein WBB64_10170, partial [Anaerolineales bacterium]
SEVKGALSTFRINATFIELFSYLKMSPPTHEEHRHLDSYLLRGSILSVWNIPIHQGTFPFQRFTGNVTITSA